ncbi:hypothetical protein AB0I72_15225 [Nocardiopsis sp. NPDC049922]|uniref:WD40 repeat domain-containing protein n=1 Tax=Nocardiopsis sp. NPDC049922 TaxID=3155157 RepID=UPI0033C702EB
MDARTVTGTVLTGHTDGVSGVAFVDLEERPHAVSCSWDGSVRTWDLADGAERTVLTHDLAGAAKSIGCAVLDGRPHAVTNHADEVWVWDLGNGDDCTLLSGHEDWTLDVACAVLDGRPHALSSSYDATVRLWDLQERGERLCASTARRHGDDVLEVGLVELDGRPHAVTNSWDVRVWDLHSGSERIVLTPDDTGDSVIGVACAQVNGRPHAVFVCEDGRVRVWDLESNRRVDEIDLPGLSHPVAFDGSRIAVGMGEDIVVFDWHR